MTTSSTASAVAARPAGRVALSDDRCAWLPCHPARTLEDVPGGASGGAAAPRPRRRPRRRAGRRRARPRPRRGRPTPAAGRWRTRRRRCRRGGRRASANRAGTVAIVQSSGSTSSTSSQVTGVETVARGSPAPSTRRPSCGRACALVVPTNSAAGSRSFRHHVVVTSRGARRSTSRAKARAARRTSGEAVVRGDPHVDVHPPAARRLGPAHGAQLVEHLVDDAGHRPHPGRRALGHGVEVDAPLVGLLDVRRREFHGWNSIVDICTAHTTWASSVTYSSSACSP